MRIRKDIVMAKADACRRGITNGDHDAAWYTCPYCGDVGDHRCRLSRDSHGDHRHCPGCWREWFDAFVPGTPPVTRYVYVGTRRMPL